MYVRTYARRFATDELRPHKMARRFSSSAVIRFFNGDASAISEVVCDGSDNELGMEDEEPFDNEPPFEPFEVTDLLQGAVTMHYIMYCYYFSSHCHGNTLQIHSCMHTASQTKIKCRNLLLQMKIVMNKIGNDTNRL